MSGFLVKKIKGLRTTKMAKQIMFAVLLISLLITVTQPAFAQMPYYVQGADNTTLGRNSYGTNGYNYVMKSPTITYQHVSSLYVDNRDSPRYFAEVGWFANPWQSNSQPRFFAAWVKKDVYGERLFEYPTPGTNHYYTVRNVTGTTEWRWYIDGVLKLTLSLGFRTGYSLASSERGSLGDTNYSHFWGLRKRDYSGNWYYWTDLYPYADTDPEYRFVKVSNTEFYVQK